MGEHVAHTGEEISMWHFEGECDIKRSFGRPRRDNTKLILKKLYGRPWTGFI